MHEQQDNTWNNKDNNAFYTEHGVQGLQYLAVRGGLINGCDVHLLKPYWQDAKNILDVNSGFGRVLKTLLTLGCKAKITGIERCTPLFQHAQKYYGHAVTLLKDDLMANRQIKGDFDALFFLWSGLADFSPLEQSSVIQYLVSLMTENGYLFIDTMPKKVKPLGTKTLSHQSFQTQSTTCVVNTYEPSMAEIEKYANASGLKIIANPLCRTDTGRTRQLYVLKKS